MQNILQSSQMNIMQQAISLLSNKQRCKHLLQFNGIQLKIQKQIQQSCLSSSILCCGCLPSQQNKLKKQQQLNKIHYLPANLTNNEQNQTLFELHINIQVNKNININQQNNQNQSNNKNKEPSKENKTKNKKIIKIGSWYDIIIFEQWQDYFYNHAIQQTAINNHIMFQPSPDLMRSQLFWYSKISIWFNNQQFKFIFNSKKQHQRIFNLLNTLKSYYTQIHPQSQYNSFALKHFLQFNTDQNPILNKQEINQLLEELNFDPKQFNSYIEQIPQFKQNQTLSQDGFMKLIQVLQCPQDLYKIFQNYAKSSLSQGTIYDKYAEKSMSQSQFNLFVKEIQQQQVKSNRTSISFESPNYLSKISKSRPQSASNPQLSLSFVDFCHYIFSTSKNASILSSNLDLSKPLAHYFVNSSHNTYLVGNQLTSMSSANVYYLNLVEGMRCVQLDIHDGPAGPMIKHGYTFTAKIYFDQAIKAIMKFCIEHPNHTPIILSFQNHCTQPNRLKMASTLSRIPFSKFYVVPKKSTNQQQFPPLQQLLGKIIIQGTGVFQDLYPGIKKLQKKISSKQKLKTSDIILQFSQQNLIFLKQIKQPGSAKKQQFMLKVKQLQKEKIQAEKRFKEIVTQVQKRSKSQIPELIKYYGMVAAPFSIQNSCWQMGNIAQNNLLKMIKGQLKPTPEEIYQYSWSSLIRIYPFGLRFGSTNYNPIPMLQCGCQLVSLNTQNVDVYYVCVQGMFEKNKQCGYTLKPDIKNQNTQYFSYKIVFMDCIDLKPRFITDNDTETCLQVSFLGSQQDMRKNSKYVNYLSDPNNIQFNEPITISQGFLSKNIQVSLVGIDKYRLERIPKILQGISQIGLYPCVQIEVNNVEFGHLYINLPHCGSMSIPLVDMRKGLRTVPIYRFEIGRKKRMGSILIWVQINRLK